MDCRSNEIVPIDDVPVDEHKFLKEIPIGRVVVINDYEYVVDRANIEKQEVILKPRGPATLLPSEKHLLSKVQKDALDKMNGKGGLGGY